MYKLYFIAKNNIKKQKGDMITFFILTFISAFLIFNCLSTLLGMGKVLDDRFTEINGAHQLLFIGNSDEEVECAKKAFEENEHIVDYEVTPCTQIYSEYRNKKDSDWKEYQFFTESFEQNKRMMKVLDVDASKLSEEDIYIPFFLKGSFAIGDTLQMKINDTIYDFNVAGYSEDPYFASSINITVYYVYISQKMTDKLLREQPGKVMDSLVCKGRIDESELRPSAANVMDYIYGLNDEEKEYYTTSQLEQEITKSYKNDITPYSEKNPEKPYLNFLAVNWQMMRGGVQFLPMVAMAVILMFAVLILVIAIIIISFGIKNFVQRNMKNTGILEASGYTIKELRAALTVQIVMAALIGAGFGVAAAFLTSGQFGEVVSSILGITWNQPNNYPAGAATIIILSLLIFAVTVFVSRVYKKITVLDALRGGISAHNFKKNTFTFERTPLPIPFVLSLKDTVGEAGKNLLLAFIVMVLTISTLMGFGMMENFGTDSDNLLKIMGFEGGTISVLGDESIEDELEKMDGVDNVLAQTGFEPSVSRGDKIQNVYTYIFRDMSKRQNTVMIEGRYAKHDNEIMITTGVADDFDVGVGDVLTITFGNKSEDYIITGIDQRMERMGRDISITFEGARKLVSAFPEIQYMITAKEGVTFDELNSRIEKLKKDGKIKTESVIDVEKNMGGTLTSVHIAMKMLCIIITIITILVVIFVEALIIRAKIVREWRTYGISKALGMTSGQIITQIMVSNVPGILAGVFLGVTLAQWVGSKVCIASFSIFGIKQIAFSISPVWDIATIIGILLTAILTAGLFGLKTRDLNPVNMITEE